MRLRWAVVIALATATACGGSPPVFTRGLKPDMSGERRDAAARKLTDASATHDPAKLMQLFDGEVTYAGLWFPDPECRRAFAVTGTVPAAGLEALAKCLAPLTIVASQLKHPYSNVAAFTYEPGI